MVGFGIATYAVSIGQAGFYQCFHLDQAQEAKKLKLSRSCKWLRRMSSLFQHSQNDFGSGFRQAFLPKIGKM